MVEEIEVLECIGVEVVDLEEVMEMKVVLVKVVAVV